MLRRSKFFAQWVEKTICRSLYLHLLIPRRTFKWLRLFSIWISRWYRIHFKTQTHFLIFPFCHLKVGHRLLTIWKEIRYHNTISNTKTYSFHNISLNIFHSNSLLSWKTRRLINNRTNQFSKLSQTKAQSTSPPPRSKWNSNSRLLNCRDVKATKAY